MNNIKAPIGWILSVIFCIAAIAVQFFEVLSNKTPYEYINQTVTLETLNNNETTAKATAVLISNTQAVTAAHIFEKDFENIKLCFYGKTETFSANLIKKDENLDLALLEFEPLLHKIKPLIFAQKTDVNFGDEIIKIGNALGYGLSVSSGIVSSPYTKLNISNIEKELIGISMPICSGDSGGGVFRKDGKFLGIISFKATPSTTDSLSFIVPSYIIKNFLT